MTKAQVQQRLIDKIAPRGIGILVGNEIRDKDGYYIGIKFKSLAARVIESHGSEYVLDQIVKYGVTPPRA